MDTRAPTRAVLVLTCLLALLASAAPVAATPGSAPVTPASVARALTECTRTLATNRAFGLEMINQHRAQAGAPPVRAHDGLNEVAQDWSRTMATTGTYEHRPEFWAAYPADMGRGGGENIFYTRDANSAAAYLHVGFVNSPGHFANMLHERHTHVGLGYACVPVTDDWGTGVWVYTTQNFGTTRDLLTAELPPAPLRRPLPDACPATLVTPNRHMDVVPDGHGHAVLCLSAWGLTSDEGTGRYPAYAPHRDASRADFAEMLHRLLSGAGAAPAGTTSGPFVDVPADHPNARAINALASMGVISGISATRFAPDRDVTRGQMASLMVRAHDTAFSRSFPSGSGLQDIAGTAHEANIRRLVGGGITVGYPDGSYRPAESMTRGQMATFHARYADLLVREQLTRVPAR